MSFSFGAPANPGQSSSFSFGAPAATANAQAKPAQSSSFSFGSTPAPAPTSLFGGSTATAAPATGGLFGAAAPAATATATAGSSGGLFSFGAKPAGANAAPASTSLFGAPAAAAAKPAGSLFGSQSNTGTTSSLFGAASTGTKPTTNLFGASTATNPTTSLFGGTTGTNPSSSLFGAKPAAGPATGGLATTGIFGNSVGGTQQNNALSASTSAAITKTTKFNDLPADAQNHLEQMESFMQERIHLCHTIRASSHLSEQPLNTQTFIKAVKNDAVALQRSMKNELDSIQQIRAKLDYDLEATLNATRIIDGYKSQATKGTFLKTLSRFPFEYFLKLADDLQDRLRLYIQTLAVCVSCLSGCQSSCQSSN